MVGPVLKEVALKDDAEEALESFRLKDKSPSKRLRDDVSAARFLEIFYFLNGLNSEFHNAKVRVGQIYE